MAVRETARVPASRDAFVKWSMRILASTVLAMILVCLYWIGLDRATPVTIHQGRAVRYDKQTDGSWLILVEWRSTRHRHCAGWSKRWITADAWIPLDDLQYPLELADSTLGDHTWQVPIRIPAHFVDLMGSNAQYRVVARYACNPLQEHVFPIIVRPPPVDIRLPTGHGGT